MSKRDPADDLITATRGIAGQNLCAAINGNIPEDWYACDLTAHRWEPEPSPRVAVFCSAKRRGKSAYGRAAGAKVTVDAGSPDADLLKLADALAAQLRARIESMPNEDGGLKIALADGAKIPERKTAGASGYDLCALADVQIQPGRVEVIDTGVMLEMPVGMEAQVRPRSGLAAQGVWGNFGSIDADYRGRVKVILANLGAESYQVNAGDRIAQLVFARIELPTLDVVDADKLTKTDRGDGGLGSTGAQ